MNDESSTLSIESLRKVDSICTQFEAAAPEDRVPLSAWLDRVDPHERDVLQRELVAVDAELRQHHDGIPESSRYRFDFPIGRGGIGTAWRVFDNHAQRPLAMKRLQQRAQDHPLLRLRFEHEALLTGSLQHPGVPPVYDHGTLENGEPYFTMKWVQGDTLHTLLKRDGANAMSLGEKIGVFEQVAQTIAYAHSLGIVHRDLKPQNIMVGQFGEVQVIDWGLAKRLDSPPDLELSAIESRPMAEEIDSATPSDPFTDSDQLTSDGDVIGTPQYMAPEQARGELGSIRPTCDVFSLGAILYQMLTGECLFAGGSFQEHLKRSAEANFSDAAERLEQHQAPSNLKDLCLRCLQPSPEDRFPDASHIADAVVRYQNDVQDKLRDTELSLARDRVRYTEQGKRQRLLLVMASAIALIGVVAAIIIAQQSRRVAAAAQEVSVANEKFQREAETSRDASEYLQSILSSPLPEKNYRDVTLREVIEQSMPRLEGRFVDKPEVEGEIRRTLGETYRWLGRKDEAEKQHRLALDAFQRAETLRPGSVDREEILQVMDRLAGTLRSRGNPEDMPEALALRTKVVDEMIAIHGEFHPDTLTAMNNLGTVLLEVRDLEAADRLYTRAQTIVEKIKGSQDDRFTIKLNHADVHVGLKRYKLAEANYRECIAYFVGQSPCFEVGNAATLLANLLVEQNRFKEAEGWYRRGLYERERFHGEHHPLTFSAMRKLARCLVQAKEYDAAFEYLKEVLATHQDVAGDDAGVTFSVRQTYAEALAGLNRIEDAEAFLKETHAVLRDGRGADHRYTLQAKRDLDEFHWQRFHEKTGDAFAVAQGNGRSRGGTHILMNDGAVKFMEEQIGEVRDAPASEYGLWGSLGTRAKDPVDRPAETPAYDPPKIVVDQPVERTEPQERGLDQVLLGEMHTFGFQRLTPDFSDVATFDWKVKSVELVSQELHRVYLIDETTRAIPRDKRDSPTRELDDFEEAAWKQLLDGDEIAVEVQTDQVQMMGALRNKGTCQRCHGAGNELLGALTYRFLRPAE